MEIISSHWEIELNCKLTCCVRINFKHSTFNIFCLLKRKSAIRNLIKKGNLLAFGWHVCHDDFTLIWMIYHKFIKFNFLPCRWRQWLISMDYHQITFNITISILNFLFENYSIWGGSNEDSSFFVTFKFMCFFTFSKW